MNCREFSHCITPAVDGRLTGKQSEQFEEHARLCAPCRRDYEEERSLAELIRARVRQARVPAGVLSAILAGTSQRPPRAHPLRPLALLVDRPYASPAVALLLILVAIVYVLTRPPARQDTEDASLAAVNDIERLSASNYEAVMKGEITPQVVSDRPDNLRTFFHGKTAFPVYVPAMKQCTLIGGGLNEFHGMRLAHVLYKHGLQFIYIYQACRESVMRGDTMHLSREAKNDLDRTGWHSCTAPDGAAIVLWVRGRTICAAVARMDREHLMAHLAEGDVPAAW